MQNAPILWIDNDPSVKDVVSHAPALQEMGIQWAGVGSEVLDAVGSGRYGLVIMDGRMVNPSEAAVLEAASRPGNATPVILTTAQGSVRNAVAAMQAGAADYLLKPFSPEALAAAVQRACLPAKAPPVTAGRDRGGLVPTEKGMISRNAQIARLLEVARNVASSKATVLILGESGTGKELLASFIHRHSDRDGRPFVAMNCAALPDTLAESELFGHEKGAFTGAVQRKTGKFELADAGTLLLDEISEMPLGLQAKLLRVLQERNVDRVGGKSPIPVDVRIIAACNQDLEKAVSRGDFREDLYYRINVIPLTLPPLRRRRDDIPLLAAHFLEKFNRINNRQVTGISSGAMDCMMCHTWKGNIRELENVMERAVLINRGGKLRAEDLMLGTAAPVQRSAADIRPGVSVREMEQALIRSTLDELNGNRTRAAEMLGISIRTLRNKLREYKEKEAA
jgi:DNA-binding NtrC family response regulator